MATIQAPVLLVGGTGIVGSRAAHHLRRLHATLPLAIGSRDATRGAVVARDVGGESRAVTVDLNRPNLGQAADVPYSAVVLFLRDDTLNTMRFAQTRGIPYLSLSSGTFEIGPEVARHIHAPAAAPVLLASHWLAGAAVMPALLMASEFAAVDRIQLGVLVDSEDFGGPAAHVDYERIMRASPAALVRSEGLFVWVDGDAAEARFRRVDGVELPARAYAPFDVMALAAATGARDVRLDLTIGESSTRARGVSFSTEIVIEVEGTLPTSERTRRRVEIVHPGGQAPLTALGAALGVERLLGLAGGAAVPPGLYLPESILEPAYYVARMKECGTEFRHVEPMVHA